MVHGNGPGVPRALPSGAPYALPLTAVGVSRDACAVAAHPISPLVFKATTNPEAQTRWPHLGNPSPQETLGGFAVTLGIGLH